MSPNLQIGEDSTFITRFFISPYNTHNLKKQIKA